MNVENQHLDALQDIRRMMQRSSRFISLSGLSGIAAGFWALVGVYFAYGWIHEYYGQYNNLGYTNLAFHKLKLSLFMLAIVVLALSLLSAFYFTWRRAGKNKTPLWNHTSKMLTINMLIPLVTGGFFMLAMLQHDEWRFVVPACLIFYGLALVNGSKYTLTEIRWLGYSELILGIINLWLIGYGLLFWAFGFGILHIIYGIAMWWRYERKTNTDSHA